MRAAAPWALLFCVTTAFGQQADLRMSRAPYYTGVPIVIEIAVSGFDANPAPTCTAPQPQRGTLTYEGIYGTGQNITIINGRKTVTTTQSFRYTFIADEPGRYRIGPFTVSQNGTDVTSRTTSIVVKDVELFDGMRLRVVLPDKPVYVGQRVPIRVEWWVLESERESMLSEPSYDFSIPLFFQGSAFNFIDEIAERGDNALTFPSDAGDIQLKVDIGRRDFDGQQYIVLSAERVMVPLQTGEFDLGTASITAGRIVGWTRDRSSLFPRRRPQYEKVRARDLPRTLVVREMPRAGQPQSFAGAVGKGFSIDVTADRTVVQVGDPITLTITLHGEGNLEAAGLPDLEADNGLSPELFSLPTGTTAGIVQEDGSKVFTTKVRVRNADVDEIPGIAYSWFDADSGTYQTTRSRPIALAVREGEVVTARDAVGVNDRTAAEPTAGPSAPATPTERPTFTLTGADLSLATGTELLAAHHQPWGNRIVLVGLYGVPLLTLAMAIFLRHRADIDPAILRRRKTLAAAAGRLAEAGTHPPAKQPRKLRRHCAPCWRRFQRHGRRQSTTCWRNAKSWSMRRTTQQWAPTMGWSIALVTLPAAFGRWPRDCSVLDACAPWGTIEQ